MSLKILSDTPFIEKIVTSRVVSRKSSLVAGNHMAITLISLLVYLDVLPIDDTS